MVNHSTDPHGAAMYPLRPDWLALTDEAVIDPGQPIIDPHHHLAFIYFDIMMFVELFAFFFL